MRLLLLEDDYSYRMSIKEFLESFSFEVHDFENGEDALYAVLNNVYDLLLLDIRVPKISGYEIVKITREQEIDIPIILITSLVDMDDLSMGYELGCNDYIRKPFALKELKYRINQAINTFQYKTNKNKISLKLGFVFDLDTYELLKSNCCIKLTSLEQKIISFLVRRAGVFVNLNEIISSLWEGVFITDADLRMHIKRIRDKTDKDFILNSRGLGYKIEKI